jgi:hypothetical protein
MKILSIDIGIKNLAFCLFHKPTDAGDFVISNWGIINISEKETINCGFSDKNGPCPKPAKYRKDETCFCLKHSKKQSFDIPSAELKPSYISKQKIQRLCEIADKYKIVYDKPVKKAVLASLINEHSNTNCFQEIETKNASKIDLISVGMNIKWKLDDMFKNEHMIDYVIIENQISPIAIRMKTIQGMIAQYFIMCPVGVDKIEFVSASNKLSDCEAKDKTNYKDRKKLGIQKCLEIITTDHRFNDKIEFFDSHNKQDDLSDAFLQGMWFIKNRGL